MSGTSVRRTVGDAPRMLARRRHTTVLIVSALLAVTAGLVAIATGSYEASPVEVIGALIGSSSDRTHLVVVDMRLPRILAALLVGAALGIAGAVFQTLSRNPLGSPDIIGFSTGSATGALVCLVLVTPSFDPAIGAWIGGIAALLAVLWISRSTGLTRDRTILAGVALAALLAAVNEYLLTRAPTEVARSATLWLYGSLTATDAADVAFLAVTVGGLGAIVAFRRHELRTLELGDDVARSLGMRVGRSQLVLLLTAAVLTGTATAVAGPIGFVALAAPQLARRAARSAGIPLAASASLGAVLLLVADVVGQRLLAPLQIPVGLVTGAIGGAYLFWLVARTRR